MCLYTLTVIRSLEGKSEPEQHTSCTAQVQTSLVFLFKLACTVEIHKYINLSLNINLLRFSPHQQAK